MVRTDSAHGGAHGGRPPADDGPQALLLGLVLLLQMLELVLEVARQHARIHQPFKISFVLWVLACTHAWSDALGPASGGADS